MSGRPRTQAWKLFATCVYGRQGWIKRAPQGHITVMTTPLATALGRRPESLQEDLEYLANLEMLEHYAWHGHCFTAKLPLPPTTAWVVVNRDNTIDAEQV